MGVKACHNIDDLHALAKRRLPSVLMDYIDGGAEDERTLARNSEAFARYAFEPRVLRDVSDVDLSVRVAGRQLALPVITAPTALSRMFHHEGEAAMARATARAGTFYTLSTVATTSLEDVAALAPDLSLFQLYIWRDRGLVRELLTRCREAGYRGVMLAVDMAAFGKRERDLRNGHGRPRQLRLNTARAAMLRPVWLYHFLRSGKPIIANMAAHLPHGGDALKTVDTVNAQFDPAITWDDVMHIREWWDGPFYLKGIQSVADASMASDSGLTGIVLSNHGGRQLDDAPATLELLPRVMDSVGDGMEVLMDGGIRRGSDVIKALALGARACLIGRAPLYGLAAGGEAGVDQAYRILEDEMRRVMQLLGCRSVSDLDASYLRYLGNNSAWPLRR